MPSSSGKTGFLAVLGGFLGVKRSQVQILSPRIVSREPKKVCGFCFARSLPPIHFVQRRCSARIVHLHVQKFFWLCVPAVFVCRPQPLPPHPDTHGWVDPCSLAADASVLTLSFALPCAPPVATATAPARLRLARRFTPYRHTTHASTSPCHPRLTAANPPGHPDACRIGRSSARDPP